MTNVSYDFDLFVIGGGSAGVRAARMAAATGARVALAESAVLGGTCVNVGCIPKKLYSFAAGYADAFAEAAGYGWQLPGEARLDWAHLKAGRAQEVTRLNGIYRDLLLRSGVQLLTGHAQLDGAHAVRVGEARHTTERVLIATGGRARVPTVPGHEHAVTSDAMFDLPHVPARLLVVGGGYIACEFASIFAGLGSQVTLVHRSEHLLAGFDRDAARFLVHEMQAAGVRLLHPATVEAIERDGDDQPLTARLQDGTALQADTVLYAIGRSPQTQGLGLASAGVVCDASGAIVVDGRYRTSAPSIHAIGDVSSRLQLTPVATAEAMAVVDHLFGAGTRKVGYDFVPTAVFTHPQLATCGYSEEAARERFGHDQIVVYRSDFKPLRHSLSGRNERTFVKLLVNRSDDRVVGLHMVGQDAAEIVQGFAVALVAGATKADFDATIGIHPTVAEEFVTLRTPAP